MANHQGWFEKQRGATSTKEQRNAIPEAEMNQALIQSLGSAPILSGIGL